VDIKVKKKFYLNAIYVQECRIASMGHTNYLSSKQLFTHVEKQLSLGKSTRVNGNSVTPYYSRKDHS